MVALYTPCFRVEIDGIDQTRKIWEYLDSVDYDDAENGEADSLSISVANMPAFAIPTPGAKIKFWLGWQESGLKYFGSFTVDEVRVEIGSPMKMSITAKSANFTGGGSGEMAEKERRDREWENISLADLAAKIAAEHGGKAKVEVSVQYQHIAQTSESNIAFLRRLATEAGATFAIKDDTFLIYPPSKGCRGKATIRYDETVSGSFVWKSKSEYGSTKTKWWDKREAKQKTVIVERSGGTGNSWDVRNRGKE